MNLLIDAGNSFIKWACQSGGVLTAGSRVHTKDVKGLSQSWEAYEAPERVLVSNVAGREVASVISAQVSMLWQLKAEFVVSQSRCCGLVNNYHKPEQLGIDRWMVMIGAYKLSCCATVVIDCGTAVTIDLIDNEGVFLGGTILPGLKTAFNSLVDKTDVVKGDVDFKGTCSVTALSTNAGVQSGMIFGLAGGIERVVKEQLLTVDGDPVIYITGGDAEILLPYLMLAAVLQLDLVLQGLSVFAETG